MFLSLSIKFSLIIKRLYLIIGACMRCYCISFAFAYVINFSINVFIKLLFLGPRNTRLFSKGFEIIFFYMKVCLVAISQVLSIFQLVLYTTKTELSNRLMKLLEVTVFPKFHDKIGIASFILKKNNVETKVHRKKYSPYIQTSRSRDRIVQSNFVPRYFLCI